MFYEEKFEPFQTAKTYDDTGGDYIVTTTTVPSFKLCDFGEQPPHQLAETAFTGVGNHHELRPHQFNFDNFVEENHPAASFF